MVQIEVMNLISDINLFSNLSFSLCYVFKSRICNVHAFICIHFPFLAPVEGLSCKPKYRANIIRHFIFVSLFIFSITLPALRISYCFRFKIWLI